VTLIASMSVSGQWKIGCSRYWGRPGGRMDKEEVLAAMIEVAENTNLAVHPNVLP
jgi:hypothetical protein